jgi:hypothetical protein
VNTDHLLWAGCFLFGAGFLTLGIWIERRRCTEIVDEEFAIEALHVGTGLPLEVIQKIRLRIAGKAVVRGAP